ncbi:MAG: alpha,alpha-trehalase [Verrucomicrobia bacterium]|nr:alpha,alpha-trehalase [Verrucomicrobiota bacterium]
MKTAFLFLVCAALTAGQLCVAAPDTAEPLSPTQGVYFAKQTYQPKPLPTFAQTRDQLPAPLLAEKPEWVAMYWKAWELAFKNFHEPAAGSGYVSQFIDAAFNQNIFLWDTCFMTLFCNYGHPLVPGIGSLDNFYVKQHEDGEICREIDRRSGRDYAEWVNREGKPLFTRWGWAGGRNDPVLYQGRTAPEPLPRLTLDALNHPILAWAELESFRVTGDRERLGLVYEPLVRYYRALQKYVRQGNGLYMTDWASMDNSPRNAHLKGGGCAADTSSQMTLFARNLATLAGMLGKAEQAQDFVREADELSRRINELMWDPERRFYFDLTLEGQRAPVKTIAAFWTLLAGVASPEQAKDLVGELNNPRTFKRLHRVPTLAADQAGYDPAGGYWCGAVWAPTTAMVIRGLERYGHHDLAREIALNHLDVMGQVFQKTGTVWENYAPDSAKPGRPAKGDFVGWSGIGPILCLLEFAVGLKPNATANELVWDVNASGVTGCERFRFNGHVASLKAEPAAGNDARLVLSVVSDGAFKLRLRQGGQTETREVTRGTNSFTFPRPQ